MKKAKASKTKALKNGMFLELDGDVYLLERKNGKEVRERLDSESVLNALLVVIHDAIKKL